MNNACYYPISNSVSISTRKQSLNLSCDCYCMLWYTRMGVRSSKTSITNWNTKWHNTNVNKREREQTVTLMVSDWLSVKRGQSIHLHEIVNTLIWKFDLESHEGEWNSASRRAVDGVVAADGIRIGVWKAGRFNDGVFATKVILATRCKRWYIRTSLQL